jgi:hypothetical protein
MELGSDGCMIFANTGELSLCVLRPSHEILKSLAQFSRARRRIGKRHFDIAAFPTERLKAWERLWIYYSKLGAALAACWPLFEGITLPLLSLAQA